MDGPPIDLEAERRKRLPRSPFVRLPDEDDPHEWLFQLFEAGRPVPGVTGLDFGLEGVPALMLTAEQARRLSRALAMVAAHLGA